jgi:hypothetical protein
LSLVTFILTLNIVRCSSPSNVRARRFARLADARLVIPRMIGNRNIGGISGGFRFIWHWTTFGQLNRILLRPEMKVLRMGSIWPFKWFWSCSRPIKSSVNAPRRSSRRKRITQRGGSFTQSHIRDGDKITRRKSTAKKKQTNTRHAALGVEDGDSVAAIPAADPCG